MPYGAPLTTWDGLIVSKIPLSIEARPYGSAQQGPELSQTDTSTAMGRTVSLRPGSE